MKEDFQIKLMSTRLRALEKSVIKLHEIVKNLKAEQPNNAANIGLVQKKVEGVSDFDVEIKEKVSKLNETFVCKVCKYDKCFYCLEPSLKKLKTDRFQGTETVTTTCFTHGKQSKIFVAMFLLVYLLSIIVSSIYIKNAYYTWQSSPVVQALSNTQVHFENISFPAVTICFPNSFKQYYDFDNVIEMCLEPGMNFGRFNTSCGYSDLATLALANLMCPKHGYEDPMIQNLFERVPHHIPGDEFDSYMEHLFPPCESDLVTLQFLYAREEKRNYTRCDSHIFQQFFSNNQNHLCMTYNGLPHEQLFKENVVTPKMTKSQRNESFIRWSYDSMMHFNGGLDSVPVYGLEEFVIVIHKKHKDYENICTHLSLDVASVIIHSPNEIPLDFDGEIEHMVRKNVRVMKVFDISVVPKISLANDDLAQYPPRQRGCLFAHEKNLSMFKLYTKRNCEIECIVNLYLMSCGCVPFFYPRQNKSVNVCLHPCSRPKNRCDCMPDCNYLTYDVTTQEIPGLQIEDTNSTPRANVRVMLRGKKFYTTIRYSITSFAEFLAYSLGVLGAFLGFSVTCMWRLLYFGVVKLWRTIQVYWSKGISPMW